MLNILKYAQKFPIEGHFSNLSKLSEKVLQFQKFECSKNICRKQSTERFSNTFVTSRVITIENVKQFASLTKDFNPIHLEYGNENQPPIVHGALLMSLVAGVIGSDFPGPGTLVLSQEMTFIAACPAGSNISIEISLENNQSATKIRKITYCNFACYNNDDKSILFMKGKAKLRIKSPV